MKSVQSPSSVLQLRRCDPRRRRGSLHQAPGRAGHRASHAHPRSLGGSWARSNGSPGMPAARGICHPPHHLIWLRIEPNATARSQKPKAFSAIFSKASPCATPQAAARRLASALSRARRRAPRAASRSHCSPGRSASASGHSSAVAWSEMSSERFSSKAEAYQTPRRGARTSLHTFFCACRAAKRPHSRP